MKAQILKIAGVKSEKEFYKKYPSEAAFMKKHGKAFKKAQMGAQIGSYTGGKTTPMQNVNLAQLQEDTLTQITGKSKKMRDQEDKDAAAQQASSKNSAKTIFWGCSVKNLIIFVLIDSERCCSHLI